MNFMSKQLIQLVEKVTGKKVVLVDNNEEVIKTKKPIDWREGDFALTDQGFVGKVFKKDWGDNGLTLILEKGRIMGKKEKSWVSSNSSMVWVHSNRCTFVEEKDVEALLRQKLNG